MNNIIIREVNTSDLHELQNISRITFIEAFAAGNTEENLKKYLDEGLSLEKLLTEIQNPDSRFYFAVMHDRIVGYLKVNFAEAQTELKDQKALEIERIYVLKEFYGKNLGKLLFDHALHLARQQQAEYIWLGVWEENERALQFYRKQGFVEFDKHIFKLGDDEQTDIMMKLVLSNLEVKTGGEMDRRK